MNTHNRRAMASKSKQHDPDWLVADRDFFSRFPDRIYRMRRTAVDELALLHRRSPAYGTPKPGMGYATVVGCIDRQNKDSGARIRRIIAVPISFLPYANLFLDSDLEQAMSGGFIPVPNAILAGVA